MQRALDAGDLLRGAAIAHKPQAEENNIQIEVTADPELPTINADPDRMGQVLGNLIRNALRHVSAGGRIDLIAEHAPSGIALKVKDNGAGIAVDDLPRIFDRFYRADQSRMAGDGESGLGLTIAKSIVEAHGGTLTVESVFGEGATFTMMLPVHS